MNIFWILVDSIRNKEGKDRFDIPKPLLELKKNKEGLFFDNVITLFPSTLFSVLSIITGKFPYYILPDFVPNPPKKIKERTLRESYFYYLKQNNWNLYSFICFNIGSSWLRELFNPVIPTTFYKGGNQLNSLELNEHFFNFFKKNENRIKKTNNLFFIHYMAGDRTINRGLEELINFLKKNNLWEGSIIIINSDHGYRTFKESLNPLHFSDIHVLSIRPVLFIKLPERLSKRKGIIDKRVYSIDIWETILDYLNIKVNYDRQAVSFRNLIEKNQDINKDRIIRGDAFLFFQPIKKTYIIKGNYKLEILNKKILLKRLDLFKNKEKTISNEKILNELYEFYKKSEETAENIVKEIVDDLFKNSFLNNIRNKKILIPKKQFPKFLIKLLVKFLEKNNNIVHTEFKKNEKYDIIIFIYNRLTGFGIRKLKEKIKLNNISYKNILYIDTILNKVEEKEGYLNFIIRELKNKRKLFIKRPLGTLIWLFYYPLYLDFHLKDYYK